MTTTPVTDTQRNKANLQQLYDRGKSFTANNADTCRFTSEGLICEHWGVFDVAAMMRQLGVGP